MCPLSSELFNYARFNDLNVLLKLLFYLMATCHQSNASLYSALFPFSLRIFATMRLIPLVYLKTTQRGESSMCAYHRPPTRWLPMLYPRPAQPRRGRDRDMAIRDRDTGIARLRRDRDMDIRDRDETETVFLCVCFFHLLNLLWPFWGIHTVDSRYNKLLGPSEITLLYQNFVISGLQNNNIQRNFELWDQENYFVISVFFIMRVHCIYLAAASLRPRAETSRHSLRGRGRGRDIRLRGRDEAKTRPRTEISGLETDLEAYNTADYEPVHLLWPKIIFWYVKDM